MDIRGFTYGYDGRNRDYMSGSALHSQELLFDIGVNWIALAFSVRQEQYCSTKISYEYGRTVSDSALIFAIKNAHDAGVKVCLKPILDCADGTWRALIDFPDSDMLGQDIYWEKWFEEYTAFIIHYAEIAKDTGCEMLCIGCEMSSSERKENNWRGLISTVRKIYEGPLIYNTNHGNENNVRWLDAVDYIGISAYYKVAEIPGARVDSMRERWHEIREKLECVYNRFAKPIVFMEIGCRSARGCAMMPYDFVHRDFPYDEDEQANFYESCLQVFSSLPWFKGIFWWDWSTSVYLTHEEAEKEAGFNIYLKKAEAVVRKWYKKV